MLNFVTELPATLEPNSIYYVQGTEGEAEHYVSDASGSPIKVTTKELVQAYMSSLKGAANGYASLDATQKIPASQLPDGSKPADISSAISTAQNSLQTEIDGKQAALVNANEVAKIGESTFDGNPMVLLKSADW